MAKTKDVRITISLECTDCSQGNKKYPGVFRYTTQKNRRNTPTRIELKKFCPYCYRRTICREIKK